MVPEATSDKLRKFFLTWHTMLFKNFNQRTSPYSKLSKLTTGAGMVQKIKAIPQSQVKNKKILLESFFLHIFRAELLFFV